MCNLPLISAFSIGNSRNKARNDRAKTVTAVHDMLVKNGKFNWQLMATANKGFGRNMSG